MSVYQHKGAKDGVYYYDFQIGGRRFSGSTGKTRKREAEAVEKALKDEARVKIKSDRAAISPDAGMTLTEAVARYWQDKHADIADTDKLLWSLEWLEKHFGGATRLCDIGDNEVARMVAKRRGEASLNDPKGQKLVSNATVNRTATEPLRQIITRARKVWKVPVQQIEWSLHMLKESQELVREATPEMEAAIFAGLKRGYDNAVLFAFRMGARREEILNLEWPHVDFINNRVLLDGKGDKREWVPFPPEIRALLWGLKDHHPLKVFTYVAAYTRRATKNCPATVRGERYPLTAEGLAQAFKLARKKAGIENFRFHDTRHTAGTQILRATGNLRIAQRILRHAKITTTMKYAHVMDADLAEAMARTEMHRSGIAAKIPEKNPEKGPLKAAND